MGKFFILRSRVQQEYNSLLVNALNRIFKSNLSLNNFKWLLTKLELSCVRNIIPRSRKRLWNGYPILNQELQNHDPDGLKKHQANRRFWDSKYRKIFPLQGLQGKQRLWRHRWVVAISSYSGGSRALDKGGGGGRSSRPWDKVGRGRSPKKLEGGPGLPGSSPRSATVRYKMGHWP